MAFLDAEDGPRVTITERWGRLLGLYAGDGSASNGVVAIACDGQDDDLIQLIRDDFAAIGLRTNTQDGRTWGGDLLRRQSVVTSAVTFVRFLRSLGLVEPDTVRRIVCIPEIIWRSPQPVVAAFLAGVFEADGSCGDKRIVPVSLSTKHLRFAREVQRALMLFGIQSQLQQHFNTARKGDPKRFESWSVRLRRSGSDLFAKEIGFLSDRKRARLQSLVTRRRSNNDKPFAWDDQITEIVECWVEPVDLQVEGSAFSAEGFISHNSFWKPLEYAALGVPWVASDLPEYRRLADMGAGVVAAKPRDWMRELGALLNSESLRDERSGRAREVAEGLTYSRQSGAWAEAWADAVTSRRAQRVAAR